MDTKQTGTEIDELSAIVLAERQASSLLKYQQEQWIDYCAVGGMLTDADGEITTMKVTQFAEKMKIPRTTLYRWRNELPNFWDRVAQRRLVLGGGHRLQKVINGVWLRASRGDAEQAKIYLGIFAGWQPPSQKHEVQIGGLVDLAKIAEKDNVIEAEVVEPDNPA